MKKLSIATIAVVLVLLALQVTTPRVGVDGWTLLETRIVVVNANGQPIQGAEVQWMRPEEEHVTVAETDADGRATIRVPAGMGRSVTLLYSKTSASLKGADYTVSKVGFQPVPLEFPQGTLRWYKFLGREVGRPKLELRCTMESSKG